MTRTTTMTTGAPEPATLWRCGGRQCGAGECEHEDGELHRHAAGGGPTYAPPIVHEVLASSGAPLPDGVRRDMELRLGNNFTDVRIHIGARAAESARSVNAHAYTVGRQVVFGAGAFNPSTIRGRTLLAHELAHASQSPHGAAATPRVLRVSSPDEPAEVQARTAAASPTGMPGSGARSAPGTVHRDAATDRRTRPAPPGPVAPTPHPTVPVAPAPPATCVPSRALKWTDFAAHPPAHSPFNAVTAFSFSSRTSGGRDWVVASFTGGSSWVKRGPANPGNRALNGCTASVSPCQRFFAGLPAGGTGSVHLGSVRGCAASVQPNTSLTATNRTECDTVLGAECDRVAVRESARLLRHEQLHLDLACALAAKGNQMLAAAPAPDTRRVLAAVRTAANSQTRAYDRDSSHGCNASGQATWGTAVAQGLPAVTLTLAAPPRRRGSRRRP